MARTATTIQERRRFTRHGALHCSVDLLRSPGSVTAESVNVSEGGLCIRLDQMLEVRSLVQLQLTPYRKSRPMACRGRVTWVMQRLDLRDMPPLLFDTGIEFVSPSPSLRQFLIRQGVELMATKRESVRRTQLEPAVIHGRTFVPRLEHTATRPSRWHLVVSVDGVACFSEHVPSERAAVTAWTKFRRRQAKR